MIAVLEGEGWGRFWGNWRIANRPCRVAGRNHFFFPALSPAPSPKSFDRHSGGRQLGKNVLTSWMRYGLAVLSVCLGIGDAAAVVGTRVNIAAGAVATPVAMCGRTCQMGGRYIPGPPSVCFQNGLEYCGRSSDAGAPPGVIIAPYERGRRDGFDDRRGPRGSDRDGMRERPAPSRAGPAPSQDNRPCRQRLTNNKGEGYWGPGRNCDQEGRR
jgi:hypothetical protein